MKAEVPQPEAEARTLIRSLHRPWGKSHGGGRAQTRIALEMTPDCLWVFQGGRGFIGTPPPGVIPWGPGSGLEGLVSGHPLPSGGDGN